MSAAPVVSPTHCVDHGIRTHARCSPSKLKTLAACPSFENDESRPKHPVTERGTAMHEAIERGDNEGLNEEEVQLVTMCRDFIAEDVAAAEQVLQEIRVTTNDPDVAGMLDMMLVMPPKPNGKRLAKIRDWKFGFNPVPSPEVNPQAIAYTVGVFMAREDIDEIDFAFCLPRLDLILQFTFHRSQLEELQLGIAAIANRVRTEAGVTYTPNIDTCTYCRHLVKCPATWDRALAIGAGVKDPNDALPLPEQFNPDQITSPEDMAKALNLADLLGEWCEKIRSRAHSMRGELGIEIPGRDWIEMSGKRTVTNPVACFAIASQFGVTQDEFLGAATISLPSVIEAVRSHTPAGTKKKDREEQFTDALTDGDIITRGSSYHVLKRAKKRVALTPELPAGTSAGRAISQ